MASDALARGWRLPTQRFRKLVTCLQLSWLQVPPPQPYSMPPPPHAYAPPLPRAIRKVGAPLAVMIGGFFVLAAALLVIAALALPETLPVVHRRPLKVGGDRKSVV